MQEESPIRGTWADADKIQCKDCFLRDRTQVTVNGKIFNVGVTRAYCAAYPEPPDSNGKPHAVLFYGENCKFYQNEKVVK